MILLNGHLHHKPELLLTLQAAYGDVGKKMAIHPTWPIVFEHSITQPMAGDEAMSYIEISATAYTDDNYVCMIGDMLLPHINVIVILPSDGRKRYIAKGSKETFLPKTK
ncbi:MAG: hypothetical protein WCI57_03565 [Candidatus Berkelbacteria bacterium]